MVLTVLSVPAGASLTGVTLNVIVFGDWSVSTPPLAVPPLSCTWKVKLASGDPIAFAAGVNSSLPAEMSAALTYWPTVTAVPLSVSVPAVPVGSVAIFTASRLLGGLSLGSLKPKSDAANV